MGIRAAVGPQSPLEANPRARALAMTEAAHGEAGRELSSRQVMARRKQRAQPRGIVRGFEAFEHCVAVIDRVTQEVTQWARRQPNKRNGLRRNSC
jgi:hypothetical protein